VYGRALLEKCPRTGEPPLQFGSWKVRGGKIPPGLFSWAKIGEIFRGLTLLERLFLGSEWSERRVRKFFREFLINPDPPGYIGGGLLFLKKGFLQIPTPL